VVTPKRQNDSPLRQLDALRNLVTAQESLDRAARRLAGVRRQVLEAVDTAGEPGGEAARK
jgi:hypothetical protein